ncbi:RNase H domain-containing protein [Phthorimaea operculella]|nr:RNase H domain-containing protein [Phthorimaea operculella]
MDRVRYRTLTAENLKGIAIPSYATTAEIDTHNNQITGTLMNCFEQTCPLVTPRRGTAVRNNWWSPDLEKLRRRLRKLFNRAKNTRAELDWDRYKETQYQYKKQIRLRKAECWRRFNSQATRIKNILTCDPERSIGALSNVPLIEAPCDRIPKTLVFDKLYQIRLSETERDQSGVNEVRIYTDGSKTKTGTGAGVFSLDLNIKLSQPLGEHSSIFQCECVAITLAANAVMQRKMENHGIRILSDSMAVLMALESNTMSSSLIYGSHLALQTIATNNKVTLQWIKGHSGSLGNDAADELARRGSEVEVAGPTPYLPIPFNQIRTWIRHQTQTQHNARWASITTCRQSKEAVPALSPRLTKRLLSLQRTDLRIMVDMLTGHCQLNKHLFTINATDSPMCSVWGCLNAEETASHVILACEGLAIHRAEILDNPGSLQEACERPRRLLSFWKELGWLT